MLGHPKLAEFNQILSDYEYFKEILNNYSEQKLGDLLDMIKSIVNDFKNLLIIILSLKKLLKANSSISVSLVLSDALERIVMETCDILNCDRVIYLSLQLYHNLSYLGFRVHC